MIKSFKWLFILPAFVTLNASMRADFFTTPIPDPVDHPAITMLPVRTPGAWRKGIERFGEDLVTHALNLQGFEVSNHKLPSNNGIDLVAMRRNSAGKVIHIRLIEVKTHYGKGRPKLSQTQLGQQMSRGWLTNRLRRLRSSGKEGKRLARELSDFHKANGVSISHFGEVHDVNLRTGQYHIRNPIALDRKVASKPIDALLESINAKGGSSNTKRWSARHIRGFTQISRARMNTWVGDSRSLEKMLGKGTSKTRLLQNKLTIKGFGRVFGRLAGPAAAVGAIGLDTYDLYSHFRKYQDDEVSRRERNIALARSGGRLLGGGLGFLGGVALGAKLGTFAGPKGATIGGILGGIVGAFSGSFAGPLLGSLAEARYASLDEEVRVQVNHWMKTTGNPFAK